MKKQSILILLVLGLQSVYAQIDSYDLSKYIQGDVRLSISSISPWFRFSTYSLDQDSNFRTLDRGNLSVYHNHLMFINSRNKYVEYNWSNSFNLSSERIDQEKSVQITPLTDLNYRANFYFSENDFIGFDLDTRNSYSYFKYFGAINTNPSTRKDYYTDSVIELSYGMGRAQNIEDPLKAIAIFRVLKQNNHIITDSISHQDVDDLSNLLNTLRGLRNEDVNLVDSRLLTNARFELLAQHLIEKKLVRADDFVMIGLLYDTYSFENYYFRKANDEFRIGLSYAYDRRLSLIESFTYKNDLIYSSPSIFMSYDLNKPLSTMWFFNGETSLEFNKLNFQRIAERDDDITTFEEKTNRVALFTQWQIQYQPSIRTRFNAGLEMFWAKSKINTDDDIAIKEDINSIEFSVGLDYYFSPQYFMSLDLKIGKEDLSSIQQYSKEISTSLDLNVNYIFR